MTMFARMPVVSTCTREQLNTNKLLIDTKSVQRYCNFCACAEFTVHLSIVFRVATGNAMERVDVLYALHKLTALEEDACKNAVHLSPLTRLRVLPNHHMNTEGELQGYHFVCNHDDPATILPMSKKTCNMTSVYECLCSDELSPQPLHEHVMRIVQNMPQYRVSIPA